MNLEVQRNSLHTFSFPESVFGSQYRYQNTRQIISNATIEITTADGSEVLSERNMSLSSDKYSVSYIWDSSDEDIGENYIVKFKIDGEYFNRFFDIYCYPFKNSVCDQDLFNEDESLRGNTWHVSGTADSGTTGTLVDGNRLEKDGYFIGGLIELYFEDKMEVREIVNFVNATKTIHFAPVAPVAVFAGLGYSARASFQKLIDHAAMRVQQRFSNIDRRAYLLIDHSQMKTPIVAYALAEYWRGKIEEKNDKYDIKYKHYSGIYDTFFETAVWKYDKDADCHIDEGEEDELTQPRWMR